MPKAAIHPNYQPSKITCACGFVYDTFSTRGDFMVEICANCHPFFTGKQKLMDTQGRIDRFNKKYGRGSGGKKDKATEADKAPEADKGTEAKAE